MFNIKMAVKNRKHVGYNVFQKEEQWRYQSERDDRVCPICLGLDLNLGIFRGDNIPALFTTWSWRYKTRVINPNTHQTVAPESHGKCRCIMRWQNTSEVMGNLIHNDFLAVI